MAMKSRLSLVVAAFAGLVVFGGQVRAGGFVAASESDRKLTWYYGYNYTDGTQVVGRKRFIVQENSNSGFSKITSWCIYLNDEPITRSSPGSNSIVQAYIYYDHGVVSRSQSGQDSDGCWYTTAVETAQAQESYERSNGFDIQLETISWPTGTNSFSIRATTVAGVILDKTVSLVAANPTTTTTVWVTTTTSTTTTTLPASTSIAQPTLPKATIGSTAGIVGSTVAPRTDTWLSSLSVLSDVPKWSDKSVKALASMQVGNASHVIFKFGIEGTERFKTRKIQLVEGINYFPTENRAAITLADLSPGKPYVVSATAIGVSGRSAASATSFTTESIPKKPRSSTGSGSGGGSGSSGGGSSGSGYTNVIGWRLDRALSYLGYSYSAVEASGCPKSTWFGIVNTSNWTVVYQQGRTLYACKTG